MFLKKTKKENKNTSPLSVIICAKDEYENLKKFLPLILNQDYPDFEVILVNDNSQDATQEFLEKINSPILKIIHIKKSKGKKNALTQGILASKNENLVFTDADCKPASKNWLKYIAQNFDSRNEIILGFGDYFKRKGLLNLLIRYDTLFIAMQYLSFALAGKTYMGVGRNLAYKKSLFFKKNGFENHKNILSGDDDLFINEVTTPNNTSIEIDQESFTYSPPKETWRTWIKQKTRHISTSPHYKLEHKILLTLEPFSRILYYSSFFGIFIEQISLNIILILFSIRLLVQFLIFKKITHIFKAKDLFIPLFLLDLTFPFLNIAIGTLNPFISKKEWK